MLYVVSVPCMQYNLETSESGPNQSSRFEIVDENNIWIVAIIHSFIAWVVVNTWEYRWSKLMADSVNIVT